MRRALLLLLLVGLLLIPSIGTATAANTVCWIYEIQVEGQLTYGGYSKTFEQAGYLAITAGIRNSSNDANIVLIMGKPSTNASAGAISFVTNGYFIDGLLDTYRTGALDLATVESWTTAAGSAVFEATIPDDFASDYGISQGLLANIFNINSGLTANVKLITAGSMWAEFWENGSVNGSIGFAGRDWTSSRTDIGYVAEIAGQYVTESSQFEDCVITGR